jgi:glyoxylase-like metal-dependent hydrolase (beta-lactamase superfamily II)
MRIPPLWRRVLLALGVLLLALGGVLAVGLSARPVPPEAEPGGFAPDLAAVRALALSGEGPLPTEVRLLEVGRGEAPRGLVVAGGGFGPQGMHFTTLQLAWADGRTVLVDPVPDEATLRASFPSATYDGAAHARVQEALRRADAVLFTHEHFDHSAGVSRSPHLSEVAPRVVMTGEQLESPLAEEAGFTPEVRARLTPLRYGRAHLLRPGVVLLKAPGHTPGTQLVFVRRQDGAELLLVGDVAWALDNVTLPRMHPRLVSWLGGEDGAALAAQLGWLHRLQRQAPGLHLVVAHDGPHHADLLRRGVLQAGLR